MFFRGRKGALKDKTDLEASSVAYNIYGGRGKTRTCDLYDVNVTL